MNKKNAMKCPKLGKTFMSFQFTLCRNSGQIREERASVRWQFLADGFQTAPKRGCQLHAGSVDDGRLLSQVGLEIVKGGFNSMHCSPYCSALYEDWRWRLETCVEVGGQNRLERVRDLCTRQNNTVTSEGWNYLSLFTICLCLDYFDDPKKQTDLPSCCGDAHVFSMKDQACISVDETRARHHFTGCGGENGTTIKLVTNEEVGQLRNLLITSQSRNKKKLLSIYVLSCIFIYLDTTRQLSRSMVKNIVCLREI